MCTSSRRCRTLTVVHRGRITQKQFCSVLRSSGFSLTEDELAVIAQAYADSRQDVYYIKFVHDLE